MEVSLDRIPGQIINQINSNLILSQVYLRSRSVRFDCTWISNNNCSDNSCWQLLCLYKLSASSSMNRENNNNSPVPEQQNNEAEGGNVVNNNNDIEVDSDDSAVDESEEDGEWG